MGRIKLKIARIEAGFSQKELSLIIGVSQQTIAKWERGTTTPAHFDQIRAIENTLHKPARQLFPDIFNDSHSLAE